MPVVEVSVLVLFGVVALGNYVESWKQTSTKFRTRVAYAELMRSCRKLQTLEGYLNSFSKYRRHLTKEENEEYQRWVKDET